jgi:DNA-binding IclR family transcriptional regulator
MSPPDPSKAVSPAGSGLGERILEALGGTESASREELQQATGASRSSVINALEDLITRGAVATTDPLRSPNRRYRRMPS